MFKFVNPTYYACSNALHEDHDIATRVKNFVSFFDPDDFLQWCQANAEPIVPKRSENGVPRVCNSFFQFKIYVARYAQEKGIEGNNFQHILSKSQSILWKMLSAEQKGFFKQLYNEAKKYQKLHYPEYRFRPNRQKSNLKIRSMDKERRNSAKNLNNQNDSIVFQSTTTTNTTYMPTTLIETFPSPFETIPSPIETIPSLIETIPSPIGTIQSPVETVPSPIIETPTILYNFFHVGGDQFLIIPIVPTIATNFEYGASP